MRLVVAINIPDEWLSGQDDFKEEIGDNQIAIDEEFLTRWDEDDSYFVFEKVTP